MKKVRDCTPIPVLRTLYLGLCQSVLRYAIAVWGGAGKSTFLEIERAQRSVIKVMVKKPFRYSTDALYNEFPVIRARNLYILNATLRGHTAVKHRPDYHILISKRILYVPPPNVTSLLARLWPFYSHIRVYNEISKRCEIKGLSTQSCKKTVQKLLLTLS
ncbi:hypothetical protein HF086_016532 [Spodoptera exigua]|uniref:Uncharacterized protein n=1 Tax=Spodoptera exigua TaxID=7107 RepID=A0A922ME93_SPOEX|nr:hypothetical protein HF086_016532 [Spodoptera exigua]